MSARGLAVLAALATCALAAPAAAATVAALPAAAATATPPDGVAAAASGLRSRPLYIDPDMAWLLTSRAERKIEKALVTSPVRTFVIAVPLSIDEDTPDYASYFMDQLYGRLHRAGVYLIVTPSGSIYDGEYFVPRDIELPASVEIEDSTDPQSIASDAEGRILTLLHLIATSPADPSQAVMPSPLYTPGEFSSNGVPPAQAQASDTGTIITAGILGLVLLGPLLALAGYLTAGTVRRRIAGHRGWGDAGDPGLPAGHMPAAPDTAWLQRHAHGELAALSRAIAAQSAANPGWQLACDDYDAGMLVATPQAEQIDLVGAIALARDGRLALHWNTAQTPPPCLLNPLHGRSVTVIAARTLRYRSALGELPGRLGLAGLPVCPRCARRVRQAGRARNPEPPTARLLRVRHDGARVRYYEFDSVWLARAFGASGPGLPQAVRESIGVS